jgi:hypothetical protein
MITAQLAFSQTLRGAMDEKQARQGFGKTATFFSSVSSAMSAKANTPVSESIDMSLFFQFEQMLCPESRDYRSYVSFLKVNIQKNSYAEILTGTFTSICLLPRYPLARNTINYLLLAIKELNLNPPLAPSPGPIETSLEQDTEYLVHFSVFPFLLSHCSLQFVELFIIPQLAALCHQFRAPETGSRGIERIHQTSVEKS